MVLQDEIARYGLSIEFGPVVSFFGKLLAGVDPTVDLNPVKKLTKINHIFLLMVIKIKECWLGILNFLKNIQWKIILNLISG